MASGRVKRDKVGYWKDKGNRYEALCNSRKSAEVLMQLFGSNEGLSEEEIVDKDIVVQILNGAMGSGLPDAVNAAQGSNTFYEEAFNPKVLDAQVAKGLMTKDSLEYKTKCAIYKCAVETKRVLEADLDSYILVGDIKKGETLEDAKMRELIAHHCVSVEASIADVVQACKEQGISPEVEQMARVVKTHDEREITAEEAHEYELQRAVLSAARAELGRVDTPQSKAALRMITRMLNGTMQSPEELQVFLETIVSDNRGFTDDAYRNSTSTNEFLQKILLRNIASWALDPKHDMTVEETSKQTTFWCRHFIEQTQKVESYKDIENAKYVIWETKKKFVINYIKSLENKGTFEVCCSDTFDKQLSGEEKFTEKQFLNYALNFAINYDVYDEKSIEEISEHLTKIADEHDLSDNAIQAVRKMFEFTKEEEAMLSSEENLAQAIDNGVFPYLDEIPFPARYGDMKRSLARRVGIATERDAAKAKEAAEEKAEEEVKEDEVKEEPVEEPKEEVKEEEIKEEEIVLLNPDGTPISPENAAILQSALDTVKLIKEVTSEYGKDGVQIAEFELSAPKKILQNAYSNYIRSFVSEEEQLHELFGDQLFEVDGKKVTYDELDPKAKGLLKAKAASTDKFIVPSERNRQRILDNIVAITDEVNHDIPLLAEGKETGMSKVSTKKEFGVVEDARDEDDGTGEVKDAIAPETDAEPVEGADDGEAKDKEAEDKESKEKAEHAADLKVKKQKLEKVRRDYQPSGGMAEIRFMTLVLFALSMVFLFTGALAAFAVTFTAVMTSVGVDAVHNERVKQAQKQDMEKVKESIKEDAKEAAKEVIHAKVKSAKKEAEVEEAKAEGLTPEPSAGPVKGAKVKNIFEDMTPEDMASASYTVGRMFTSLEDTIAAAADGEATMEEAATIGKETEEPVVEEEATEEPAPEDVIEEIPEEESAPEEPVEEVEEEDEEIVEEVPEDVPPVIEEIEDYLDGEPEEVPEEATAEEKKKTYIQTHLNSFTGTGPSKTLEEGGRELEY